MTSTLLDRTLTLGKVEKKSVTLKSGNQVKIPHYEKSLGATHVGGSKMVIFPQAALTLIKKYFLI